MKHFKKVQTLLIFLFLANTFFAFSQNEKNTKSDANTPIFEIKNDANQTVFAVYPGGVKIFIEEPVTKAAGGGFTVGRLNTGKATGGEIFSVNPNDVRITFNSQLKAAGGGFTVGRLNTGKAVGDVENFMNITQDNYFIGHNVAPNVTTGLRNSVLGYNAAYLLGGGSDNIFIGNKAGYNTGEGPTGGNENVFIGNEAGYNSTSPVRNVFVGHQAGRANVTGQYNTYIGNNAGRNGTGTWNTVFGGLAASTNDFGSSNVIIGYVAGRDVISSRNIMIGQGAGYDSEAPDGGNVFIGYQAGTGLAFKENNNKLAISNKIDGQNHPTLIYGEFDNEGIAINGTSLNGKALYVYGDAGGEAAWDATSDERLKKSITTVSEPLKKVMALRGVNFYWKDKKRSDRLQMGFIAQEAKLVIPEVVNKGGEYYSMQYAPITAVLVEAIKEQQIIINKLESRITELEKKNNVLTSQVSDFKSLKAELDELKALVKEVVKTQNSNNTAEVDK